MREGKNEKEESKCLYTKVHVFLLLSLSSYCDYVETIEREKTNSSWSKQVFFFVKLQY